MSDCPNCGGDTDRGRWVPGGCTCKREPKQQDGDGGDILDTAEHFDYITPVSDVTGANKYLLFVLALFLIAGVFITHGVLWG